MRTSLSALAATVALAAVAAPAAPAATVHLRVDSASAVDPLFDGPVGTLPHPVDGGDGSGPHACAGPADGTPDATATGALDDAMRGAGISWRGGWDPSFRDFFIDRIGPWASAEPDLYWSISVNGRPASGGCLASVADGDSVLFHYGPLFGAPPTAPGKGGGTSGGGAEPGATARADGPPAARLKRAAVRATSFLRRSREESDAGWGRLALALRRGDGAGPAAAVLLGERLDGQRADGSIGGDVNATAVGVLALSEKRPRAARHGAVWLASAQGDDGGFGFRPGAPADTDSSGLAAWALALSAEQGGGLGSGALRIAARKAAGFVASAQSADGGFPSLPGGASNAQSTGFALVALRVAGLGPRLASRPSGRTALDYLLDLARRDGSIAYAPGSSPTPTWTTAQALLGLTGRSKLLSPAAAGRP